MSGPNGQRTQMIHGKFYHTQKSTQTFPTELRSVKPGTNEGREAKSKMGFKASDFSATNFR